MAACVNVGSREKRTTHFSAPLRTAFFEEARPLLSVVDVPCC